VNRQSSCRHWECRLEKCEDPWRKWRRFRYGVHECRALSCRINMNISWPVWIDSISPDWMKWYRSEHMWMIWGALFIVRSNWWYQGLDFHSKCINKVKHQFALWDRPRGLLRCAGNQCESEWIWKQTWVVTSSVSSSRSISTKHPFTWTHRRICDCRTHRQYD
jgi:hypothetical protein